MAAMRILFVSGSIGLGHVVRDLAIAQALRDEIPGVELVWLAGEPALQALQQAGATILPEASAYADLTHDAERSAHGHEMNVLQYALHSQQAWARNVQLFDQIMQQHTFDLVIGDETYEIQTALNDKSIPKRAPFVILYDFVGLDAMTHNPLEWIGVYVWNRLWAKDYWAPALAEDLSLFIGELADVPDKRLGIGLPNRRDLVRKLYQCVGYVLPFDPATLADQAELRARLGYDERPLVLCAVGGTCIGRELLTLCAAAYPLARRQLPELQMVLVCGPRIDPASIQAPPGVTVRGYVPALYEHFAACDLAIVQGGGTTTLELTALRRPFLYFPLTGHSEQQLHVAPRLARHGAGTKLNFRGTTAADLAGQMVTHIGEPITYPPIPTDGAARAAQLIAALLAHVHPMSNQDLHQVNR